MPLASKNVPSPFLNLPELTAAPTSGALELHPLIPRQVLVFIFNLLPTTVML